MNNTFANTLQTKSADAVKFAILTDIHYYAPELYTTGAAFKAYLASDRKLLAESHTTLISAIDLIKKSDAEVILICGDLTKDGELISHQQVAVFLKQLTACRKKVSVINGNHDIYNPEAYSYSESSKSKVANIGPEDFKNIYSEFGYSQALATDTASLSYVVEPVECHRIIAMDFCKYGPNNISQPVSGEFSVNSLNWVKNQLEDATLNGKMVFGIMHHGIVAHFSVQPEFFPDYILDNYDEVGEFLSNLGLKVVFTGHFHAQNISKKTFSNNNTLIDIETVSLVTYPIPYRFLELSPDRTKLKITSHRVIHTSFPISSQSFQTYAKKFTAGNMKELLINQITNIVIRITPELAPTHALAMARKFSSTSVFFTVTLGDLFTNVMLAHYRGDVDTDGQTQAIYEALATSINSKTDHYQQILGKYLLSIGTASPLGDNNLSINISTLANPFPQNDLKYMS